MKLLLRTLTFILLFGISSSAVYAQEAYPMARLNWSVQASLGITTAESPFGYAVAFGVGLDLPLSEVLTLGTSVGYSRLLTKDTSPIADYDFIPLMAKVKILPTVMPIYVMGLTGVGFGIRSGSKPSLIYGGGLGYEWMNLYDLNLKFEGYQQTRSSATYQPFNGQFAIGISYRF